MDGLGVAREAGARAGGHVHELLDGEGAVAVGEGLLGLEHGVGGLGGVAGAEGLGEHRHARGVAPHSAPALAEPGGVEAFGLDEREGLRPAHAQVVEGEPGGIGARRLADGAHAAGQADGHEHGGQGLDELLAEAGERAGERALDVHGPIAGESEREVLRQAVGHALQALLRALQEDVREIGRAHALRGAEQRRRAHAPDGALREGAGEGRRGVALSHGEEGAVGEARQLAPLDLVDGALHGAGGQAEETRGEGVRAALQRGLARVLGVAQREEGGRAVDGGAAGGGREGGAGGGHGEDGKLLDGAEDALGEDAVVAVGKGLRRGAQGGLGLRLFLPARGPRAVVEVAARQPRADGGGDVARQRAEVTEGVAEGAVGARGEARPEVGPELRALDLAAGHREEREDVLPLLVGEALVEGAVGDVLPVPLLHLPGELFAYRVAEGLAGALAVRVVRAPLPRRPGVVLHVQPGGAGVAGAEGFGGLACFCAEGAALLCDEEVAASNHADRFAHPTPAFIRTPVITSTRSRQKRAKACQKSAIFIQFLQKSNRGAPFASAV